MTFYGGVTVFKILLSVLSYIVGINLSCPKVRASPESARQMNGTSNGGAVSPNSDSRDDSGVSEDNTSSANSSSEHVSFINSLFIFDK